jgi:hypothetical protein
MAGDDGRAQVQLDEDILARRRRVLGEDHPGTLAAATNLAVSVRLVVDHIARWLRDEEAIWARSQPSRPVQASGAPGSG